MEGTVDAWGAGPDSSESWPRHHSLSTDETRPSKRTENYAGLIQQPELEHSLKAGQCQRFNYCLCKVKTQPDEAQACALPSEQQTMQEKKNNHIEALFGEIQDDLEALLNDGYSLKFH